MTRLWWATPTTVAAVAHHLAHEDGWTGVEIADLVAMPWRYGDDYARVAALFPPAPATEVHVVSADRIDAEITELAYLLDHPDE